MDGIYSHEASSLPIMLCACVALVQLLSLTFRRASRTFARSERACVCRGDQGRATAALHSIDLLVIGIFIAVTAEVVLVC